MKIWSCRKNKHKMVVCPKCGEGLVVIKKGFCKDCKKNV